MDEEDRDTMLSVAPESSTPFAALGRFLKQRRIDRNLKPKDIIEKSSLNKNTVTAIESGENVNLDTLHRYAVALGYRSVTELFKADTARTLKLLRLWKRLGDEDDEWANRVRDDALKRLEKSLSEREG
jgi:transcriptional regulator with XRE-family HTH domain